MASVYALRLFIRAMHNRVGERVDPRELTLREGAVLAPFLAVILFMSIYPQLALRRSEASVKASVASVAPRPSSAGLSASLRASEPGEAGHNEASQPGSVQGASE